MISDMVSFEGWSANVPEPEKEKEKKKLMPPPEMGAPSEPADLGRTEANQEPEPVMTLDELAEQAKQDRERTDKVEVRRAVVDDFLSLREVKAELQEARTIFHGNDFRDFIHLSTILGRLRDYYEDFSRQHKANLSRLPREVFVKIIGDDYLAQTEQRLLATGEQFGLYLPYDELGGGDYLEGQVNKD